MKDDIDQPLLDVVAFSSAASMRAALALLEGTHPG
jgi:hypothetical protein